MTEPLNYIPVAFDGYVPFGHYEDVAKIVNSGVFFPTYIAGLSGNGKTLMVNQICANGGREMIRANITGQTDEDDLIGGFRLVNGETQWQDGPAVVAMKRGAVLLLDEVDLGTPKMMCLQSVLEGSSVFIKKTGETVYPAKGFNIIATANTKGRGSDDDGFVGTMMMNEAFLERFAITFDQEYPPAETETDILLKALAKTNTTNDNFFVESLVAWARAIREMYQAKSVDSIITTRRLVHIITAYSIFGDKMKSIELGLNRFAEAEQFKELYIKLDEELAEARARAEAGEPEPTPDDNSSFPF